MASAHPPTPHPQVTAGSIPRLRVGTRGSPLALRQTEIFLDRLRAVCPVLRDLNAFERHVIATSGDQVQDRSLAEIGGKGLFAKEIHEALIEGRIDFAVHSLKDLETVLPAGIVLACTLAREDARDAIILRPGATPSEAGPFAILPRGAMIGTASVRRQAQLLHARPDLRFTILRGNIQTRLAKVAAGVCDASLLAIAGLQRMGLEAHATRVLSPEEMVPAAGQGIVGVTVRAQDEALCELLREIEDPAARGVSTAERALLGALDGSCRTPIGGHAQLLPDGELHLTGLVAREDGSFLLRRAARGGGEDAARIGQVLGESLRRDSPADLFG